MQPNEAPSVEQAPLPKPERSADSETAPVEQAPPSQERLGPPGDRVSQGGPAASTLPTPVVSPPPTKPAPVADEPIGQATTGPAIADDVDVIEKEWVDKAKTIVNTHKHDPYNQEKEASKLQADYLKKRYGKDIKLPE